MGRSIILLFTILSVTKSSAVENDNLRKLADGSADFALDMHKQLSSENENSNTFYSPLSISVALGMVYLGARGQTATQIKDTLSLNSVEDENMHEGFSDLLDVMEQQNSVSTLRIVNEIFAEQNYTFLNQFLTQLQEFYKTEMTSEDFCRNYEQARASINDWVEQQTNDKITELMPEGSITQDTKMVLVNALYFRSDWKEKFSEDGTKDRTFTLSNGDVITVPMMNKDSWTLFGLGRDDNLQCVVLEIPFLEANLSMFFMLPTDRNVDRLTNELRAKHLTDPRKEFNIQVQRVDVTIPKFKVEQSIDLKRILPKLGIKHLFKEKKADLSGMDGSRLLFVDAAEHKSYIDLNEGGVEAAAATGFSIVFTSMPARFNANHPFLYFIREKNTKSILFLGKLENPIGTSPSKHRDKEKAEERVRHGGHDNRHNSRFPSNDERNKVENATTESMTADKYAPGNNATDSENSAGKVEIELHGQNDSVYGFLPSAASQWTLTVTNAIPLTLPICMSVMAINF